MTTAVLPWVCDLIVSAAGDVVLPDGASLGVGLPAFAVGATGSGPLTWLPGTFEADEDEVRVGLAAGPLRATVRHHVYEGQYDLRLTIANVSDVPVTVSGAVLEPRPGATRWWWVWAAGAAAVLAVGSHDLAPIAVRLRAGQLGGGPDGLTWVQPGARIEAGGRVYADLRAVPCQSWPDVDGFVPHWLPQLVPPPGYTVTFARPDAVISSPDGEVIEDGTEVCVGGRGPVRIHVDEAGRRLDLVADLSMDIAEAAEGAVAAVGPVRGEADAVVLLAAEHLTARYGPADEVQEAQEILTQRLRQDVEDGRPLDPFGVAALAQELARDPELAARAMRACRPGPGMGIALARVWTHMTLQGADVTGIGRLAATLADGTGARDWLTGLEWDLLVAPPHSERRLPRLMLLLGAGLPGDMLGPVDGVPVTPLTQARAVAVASLLPDTATLSQSWPTSIEQAATLTGRRLLSRHPDDLRVLGWLLLALS